MQKLDQKLFSFLAVLSFLVVVKHQCEQKHIWESLDISEGLIPELSSHTPIPCLKWGSMHLRIAHVHHSVPFKSHLDYAYYLMQYKCYVNNFYIALFGA